MITHELNLSKRKRIHKKSCCHVQFMHPFHHIGSISSTFVSVNNKRCFFGARGLAHGEQIWKNGEKKFSMYMWVSIGAKVMVKLKGKFFAKCCALFAWQTKVNEIDPLWCISKELILLLQSG